MLLMLVLPACEGGAPEDDEDDYEIFTPPEESVEVKWAFFVESRGDNTREYTVMSDIFNALNVRLRRQGVGIHIKPEFIFCPPMLAMYYYPEYKAYEEFLLSELTSGYTEYDLITSGTSALFDEWARDGLLEDIAPYLDRYLNVRNTVAKDKWERVTFGGKIFALPTDLFSPVIAAPSGYEDLFLRADNNPPYFPDAQSFFDFALERHEENGSVLLFPDKNPGIGEDHARPLVFLHKSYDQWPFVVSPDFLFYFDRDGSVSSYAESEIFRQDAEWMFKFREAGLIVNGEEGNIAPVMGSFYRNLHVANHISEFAEYGIAYENGRSPGSNLLLHLIPKGRDPEPVLMFFDWLYSSKANYDLLTLGIKGGHYMQGEDEDALPELLSDSNGKLLYGWGRYMDYQVSLEHPRGNALADAALTPYQLYARSVEIKNIPSAGFAFDPSPVQGAYDAVIKQMSKWNEYGNAWEKMRDGKEDFVMLAEVIEAFKAAGLDTVVAECQRQLDEYRESIGR